MLLCGKEENRHCLTENESKSVSNRERSKAAAFAVFC